MSFVDPVTVADPVTGTKATAALLNTWRANDEFLHGVKAGCRARTNTATVLNAQVVPFELEDVDNNAMHSTSSNTSRLTVPTNWGGTYRFGFTIRMSNTAAFQVIKNGVTTAASSLLSTSTTATGTISSAKGTGDVSGLVAGDYLELYCASSATVSVTFNPIFWCQWIGG